MSEPKRDERWEKVQASIMPPDTNRVPAYAWVEVEIVDPYRGIFVVSRIALAEGEYEIRWDILRDILDYMVRSIDEN